MRVLVKTIKESPIRIFATGCFIGLIFGSVFGMLYENEYGLFSDNNKNIAHERRMKDLEYLEKLILIKKNITVDDQDKSKVTFIKLDSMLVWYITKGMK